MTPLPLSVPLSLLFPSLSLSLFCLSLSLSLLRFRPAALVRRSLASLLCRVHWFQVQGLQWLTEDHNGTSAIDGVYLDELAFDRSTMQRMRKAVDQHRSGALFDLHSCNKFHCGVPSNPHACSSLICACRELKTPPIHSALQHSVLGVWG